MKDKFNLIIIGPQGSGKGTQAELLAKKFNMQIIAPGDLIREKIKKDTPLSQKINKYLQKGELLPDKYIEKLIFEKLRKIKKNQGIIFDAFPRSLNQAHFLKKFLNRLNFKETIAIFIKISRKTAISRIASRRICPKCGKILFLKSKEYQQGICSKCQVKIVQRDDDKPKAVKRRLEIYFQETQKIIDYYKEEGKLIEVNGKPVIEKVNQDILENLNDYFEKQSRNQDYAGGGKVTQRNFKKA